MTYNGLIATIFTVFTAISTCSLRSGDALFCESEPVALGVMQQYDIYIFYDGIKYASAALEACPGEILEVNFSNLGAGQAQDIWDQIRHFEQLEQSSNIITARARVSARITSSENGIFTLWVTEVRRLEPASVPEGVPW